MTYFVTDEESAEVPAVPGPKVVYCFGDFCDLVIIRGEGKGGVEFQVLGNLGDAIQRKIDAIVPCMGDILVRLYASAVGAGQFGVKQQVCNFLDIVIG